MNIRFKNRQEAGILLARQLMRYAGRPDVIVLALPRGGVPVGFQVAAALSAPLDVVLARKIGMPGYPEYAIGAISHDQSVFQDEAIEAYGMSPRVIEPIVARERKELERRELLYRAGRPPLQLGGKVVILVDDGLATGSTMRVALQSVRKQKPARIVAAVPVAAAETRQELAGVADEVVCISTPMPFYGVGQWYVDFEQTEDEEVIRLLQEAERNHPLAAWMAVPAPYSD
ncbi:phosphoribosyltransferase [Achromobacter anxifer]|uniref:phosphoribosyltransferase n=1 Tax=Achromobacter anxifer TaxID=1287737 RepID=UPI0023F66BF2|nr:phosphoribosyltransferase family protein [Achromobacter anxifer]MDF8364814.1 phosphoribosyltransferase family protein [Achromobacter anxifer]